MRSQGNEGSREGRSQEGEGPCEEKDQGGGGMMKGKMIF